MVTEQWAQEHYRKDLPKLGDYVVESTYGHQGRVWALHYVCPEDEAWLAQQSDQSVRDFVEKPWASVLLNSGSIVTPLAHLRVVDPFPFNNEFGLFYFRDQADAQEE